MAELQRRITEAEMPFDEALSAMDAYYVLDPSGRNLHWVCIYYGEFKTHAEYRAQDVVEGCPSWEGKWFIRQHPNCSYAGSFFQLSEPLRNWLAEQNLLYQLDHRWQRMKMGWYVGFELPSNALMFKLAWGVAKAQ